MTLPIPQSLRTPTRYFLNTVYLAHKHDGWRSATTSAARLAADEVARFVRLQRLKRRNRGHAVGPESKAPLLDVPEILEQFDLAGIPVATFTLDRDAFDRHREHFRYPRFYAGGPVSEGGFREAKALEYFISLALLPISSSDVVVDVASEHSVFPELVGSETGARVLRQDLIYPAGVHGDRIGGSADAMPLPDQSVDKLFLHNSFEHFEGETDSNFIREAWRLLRPNGTVCIIPLYLSTRPQIITDPANDTEGVVWDDDAQIVSKRGHRNRFGRFYSVETFRTRVLAPATECGFGVSVYHLAGADPDSTEPVDRAYRGIGFAALLTKP
jgi:SAM-dependent methyltransferase